MAEEDLNDKEKESESDKDYGLPKIDITPIQQSEAATGAPLIPQKPEDTTPKAETEASRPPESAASIPGKAENGAGKDSKRDHKTWIIWLLLLVILGMGTWFYFNCYEHQMGEEAPIVTDDVEKHLPPEPEPDAEEIPDEIPTDPVEKISLTEIKSRADSPRYFVVVGSFIDEDLARDYSGVLNQKGLNTYLVHPYGDIPYHRLSIGHFESFDLAVQEMNRVKADFDENLWVLKY